MIFTVDIAQNELILETKNIPLLRLLKSLAVALQELLIGLINFMAQLSKLERIKPVVLK